MRTRRPGLAFAALGFAALLVAGWYAWRRIASGGAGGAELARLEQALEGPGSFALVNADLAGLRPLLGEKGAVLERGLLGAVGLPEVESRGELSRALLALSRESGRVSLSAVLIGHFDLAALERALGESALVRVEESFAAGRRVLYVARTDIETCEESRIGVALDAERIALAEAPALAGLLERLGDAGMGAAEEDDGARLVALRSGSSLELPERLASAGTRALVAELGDALGAEGRLRASAHSERGARVGLDVELEALDPARARSALMRWAEALHLTLDGDALRAHARLDDPATALPKLADDWLVLAASAFQSAPSAANPALDAWPTLFREQQSLASAPAYRADLPLAGAADAIAGPFGIRVESVRRAGAGLEIELRAVGPDLPNTPAPHESPRLVLDAVRSAEGMDLLDAQACGPGRADAPQPLLRGSPAPLVEARKRLRLRPGAGLDAVDGIRGRIELDLAVHTQSALAGELHVGQTLEVPGIALELAAVGPHGVAYRVHGDASKLLQVRGLDASGRTLAGREAWQAELPVSGERVGALRFAGALASLEAIFALERERGEYAFALESARPGSDGEALHVESSSFIDYSAEQYDREFHALRSEPRPYGGRFVALAAAGPFQVGLGALGSTGVLAPQLTVIAPDIPNLTYNATGLELRLERVALRERGEVAPALRVPVAPGHRFGNLELEGEVQLTTAVSAAPAEVEKLAGRLVVRLPARVDVLELANVEPGSSASSGRNSFELVELARDGFTLRMRGPLGHLFSARAYTEDDRELAVKRPQIGALDADDARELRFRVQGQPRRIAIQLARGSTIRRYPFELALPAAVPAAPAP